VRLRLAPRLSSASRKLVFWRERLSRRLGPQSTVLRSQIFILHSSCEWHETVVVDGIDRSQCHAGDLQLRHAREIPG
jgi:hypothetical protein